MELVKVGEKTYYLKNNTNIGIYKINDNDIYLIDTGNDKDAGKKILKIVNENNWNVVAIINTHSNADHIGGNKVIVDRTNCLVYSHGMENCFIKYPLLEPSFLYGGKPFKELKSKFLYANATEAIEIANNLPEGLTYFELKGHFLDMIGIKTSDDVYFLGDSLFSEETINKYHIFFLYDVEEYLNTLNYLSFLKGKLFIPSHGLATSDITELIEKNREKIKEIIEKILYICTSGVTFEELLHKIFTEYNLVMNESQYVLIGSTIKSYLAYLKDLNKITYEFIDNKMIWKITA